MKLISSLQITDVDGKNSNFYELGRHSEPNLHCIKIFLSLLLISFFLLSGCTTTPIQDRNFSEAGGFWEQDENTDPRFSHASIAGNEIIGVLYASGKNTMLNRSRVEAYSEIRNNDYVTTGPESGARIEFKGSNNMCLIRVEDFSHGKSYGNTANCQHRIITKHAAGETHNTIYHINASQQHTEFTVLRGTARLVLISDTNKAIVVNSGEEAILTADAISGPHTVSPDEINKRIRWRENHQFSKSTVDWTKVLIGVGAVGAAAATAIILHKSGGKGPGSSAPPTSGGDTGDVRTNTPTSSDVRPDTTINSDVRIDTPIKTDTIINRNKVIDLNKTIDSVQPPSPPSDYPRLR